jgi:DNA-binding NarL/FixJ family response regulator
VIDLLLQGEPIPEIAEALGVSRQTVHVLKKRWIDGQ